MPSKIEWLGKNGETWNPIVGCSKVGEGCAHCYAERTAHRLGSNPATPQYHGLTSDGHWTGEVRFVPEQLDKPLRWRKPRSIFVCSMGDLFHPYVEALWRGAIFGVMAATPQHRYVVLTKRTERVIPFFSRLDDLAEAIGGAFPDDSVEWRRAQLLKGSYCRLAGSDAWPRDFQSDEMSWPLPNVWIGPSVWDQDSWNMAAPHVAALKGAGWQTVVSAEPLLGPIDIMATYVGATVHDPFGPNPFSYIDALIVGGETGPGLHGWEDATGCARVGRNHSGRRGDGREHNDRPWGVDSPRAEEAADAR